MLERQERSQQQPRGRQEDDRQRHFGDDHRRAEPGAGFRGRRLRTALLQSIRQVESRGMQCRHEAEDHRRHQRESEREEDNGLVHPHIVDPGQVGGCQRHHSLDEHRREQEARQPGHAGEHAALGEQLPHHTTAAGAERGAERDLARPARGPRQQEVRDVGAPDEPHDAHGAHQHPQGRLEIAGQPLLQRNQADGLQAIFRILPRERVADGPHLRLCAREVCACFQLPDGVIVVIPAVCSDLRRAPRRPEVSGAGITKSWRRHSNNLQRAAVHRELLPDRGFGAAEVRHCPLIPHDGDRRPPRRATGTSPSVSRRPADAVWPKTAKKSAETYRALANMARSPRMTGESSSTGVSAVVHRHLLEHIVVRLPVEKVGT